MGLKRKKGFNIATKSVKAKLVREGFDLTETKRAFNEVVEFYFLLVSTRPEGIDIPVSDDGGWRFYEILTQDNGEFPLPFAGFPSSLKRAAIRRAIGAYSAWDTAYQKWINRPEKYKHHRPPVQPRTFSFSPQMDKGMWKDDDGESIVLKILMGSQWKWIKFRYHSREIGDDWVKGSPSLIVKGNNVSIVFPLERYVPATGGLKTVLKKDIVRVASVDVDLDDHLAIVSILESKASGEVRELARHFISTPLVKLRKRDLGRVAIKMSQTKIVCEGFASNLWTKLHNREVEMGRAAARQVVDLSVGYGCEVIAFEHLTNLKPAKGKYSKRSNKKRAYWLKSRLFSETNRVAYNEFGILTTRVSPRNTSRLDPWGNAVNRGSTPTAEGYHAGADWVNGPRGYKAHSGINAARNIGLKAIARHSTNPPTLYLGKEKPVG
jgi:transposase